MKELKITLPLDMDKINNLEAGDYVYLTGTVYTARDAAHKRMDESLKKNEKLPIDIKGAVIYYLGPSPARPGAVIGSAGPTTSGRMDLYTPTLLNLPRAYNRGFKIVYGRLRYKKTITIV